MTMLHTLSFFLATLTLINAFQMQNARVLCSFRHVHWHLATTSSSDGDPTISLEDYLKDHHGIFVQALLTKNDKVWKAIRQEGSACTIFAPSDQDFVDLGDKRRMQFMDDRNKETVEKIASYHVIGEPVTAEELFASGGVITMGGEIQVDRSITGGMFGFWGKEDGGVTINGAKVMETINIGDSIIHSVDTLVSPNILWRYMDQLRIPGSS
eukprot:CAMPEP_0202490808 /NCGR_PEP_ID=MMETSP1361-20130828/8103_1 /ASSEMBLY_ACC=CAM_ASM_000849 /TAXON_ID=210615 /ORGANISM="Staurosira complex sp., Strain CCMP2646" /LENGTH=210 /DNA_ID=CAMNT_0049120771 /DNA_START=39 /DNA_END=671 /DNA_ORIENTATION=-